ncbi:hypothetical protein EDB83DRAFT_2309393 [Lactarius deliciosus]|nr:hypothetical protein EDB83DRAFT_2309393 [Lactarius deliciosus]
MHFGPFCEDGIRERWGGGSHCEGGMAKTAQYYTGAILLWTLASGTASSPPITFIALMQQTRDWLRKAPSSELSELPTAAAILTQVTYQQRWHQHCNDGYDTSGRSDGKMKVVTRRRQGNDDAADFCRSRIWDDVFE